MEFCYNVEECNNLSVHMFLTQFSGFRFEVEKVTLKTCISYIVYMREHLTESVSQEELDKILKVGK